ncbi:MAG: hypothetical protein BWK80_30480 [Desulfobacteraceae bacterium IS3]|nr:MAG: hypothetical protein BWK80_30480 [Desulfobacteraceae bacterium IS3]
MIRRFYTLSLTSRTAILFNPESGILIPAAGLSEIISVISEQIYPGVFRVRGQIRLFRMPIPEKI